MTDFNDVIEQLQRVENLISEGIQISDEPEEVLVPVVGSSIKKKTGRRVLTVKIPYAMDEKFVLSQLHYAGIRAEELKHEVASVEKAREELTKLLLEMKQRSSEKA